MSKRSSDSKDLEAIESRIDSLANRVVKHIQGNGSSERLKKKSVRSLRKMNEEYS